MSVGERYISGVDKVNRMRRTVGSLILIISILIMFSSQATAISSGVIIVSGCGIDQSTVACGDSVVASCSASVNFGAETIVATDFIVSGKKYSGALTSGNSTNGVWSATIPIDATNAGSVISLDNIITRTSSNNYCQGTEDRTSSLCLLTYSSARAAINNCVCDRIAVAGTPQKDNTVQYTLTPNEGCVDQTITTYTDFYDYCDPGWVLDEVACNIDRSQGDGFSGTAIATFSPSDGQACCSETNLDSDCRAPIADNSEITCDQGYWLSEYNDVSATRKNAGNKVFSEPLNARSTAITSSTLYGNPQRQLEPIVFDIDNDGVVETITFTNPGAGAGTITVYDPNLNIEQTINTGRTILGDPGLFEFDTRQGLSNSYISGINGGGIAIITDGGFNHMELYLYQAGSLQQIQDILLTDDVLNSYSEAASVFCDQQFCYTVVGGNTLVQVHATTGSIQKAQFPSSSAIADGGWRNMPAKVPDFFSAFGDLIVSKGFDASGNVEIVGCYVASSISSCTAVSTLTSDPLNVSEIYIGPKQYISGSGTAYSPVYYTSITDGSNSAKYNVAYLEHSDTPTFLGETSHQFSSTGSEVNCPIAPAAAECPDEGVFFASAWDPSTVTTVIVDNLAIPFEWSAIEQDSYGILGSVGTYGDPDIFTTGSTSAPFVAISNGVVGAQYCSNNICYQISGITGQYTLNTYDWTVASMFVSENGGSWGNIPDNPFLNRYLIANDNGNVIYDDCYVSDNYIAWGSLDGDLYAVRTNTVEISDVPVANVGDTGKGYCYNFNYVGSVRTPIQDRWQGMYVDRYNVDLGVWESVFNDSSVFFDNAGTWPLAGDDNFGGNLGKRMICDSDRCFHIWIDENGDQGVLEIYGNNIDNNIVPTVRVVRPQITLLSADMSNVNTASRLISGFTSTPSYDYFAFRSTSTGTGFVGRMDNANTGTFASVNIPWVTSIQGLRAAPGTEEVYYSLIPSTWSAGSVGNEWCPFMNNSASRTSPNYAFKSYDGDVVLPVDGAITVSPTPSASIMYPYTLCNYEIWKATSNSFGLYYTDQVSRWSTGALSNSNYNAYYRSNAGIIIGPSLGWSIGDFDENGEYYAAYIDSMCIGSGGDCVSQIGHWVGGYSPYYVGGTPAWPGEMEFNSNSILKTYAVFQKDKGVTFPLKNYYADVSLLGDGYTLGNEIEELDLRRLASSGGKVSLNLTQCAGITNMDAQAGEAGCKPLGTADIKTNSYRYGQYLNTYGDSLSNIHTWDNFKASTSRFTLGQNSLNRPIYAIIGATSLSAKSFTYVGCYVSSIFSGSPVLSKKGGSAIPITGCPAQLISSDVDRDGVDEVIFAKGIYEFANSELIKLFDIANNAAIAVVDITSDSYLDFVFMTQNIIKLLISTGDVNIQYSETLSANSLNCAYEASSGTLTASLVGIGAKNFDALSFSGLLKKVGGSTESIASSQNSSQLIFTPKSVGNYQVIATVSDVVSQESLQKTCDVAIVSIPESTTKPDVEVCRMSPDGEFNYLDFINYHGWTVSNGNNLVPSNGWLTVNNNIIKYVLSECSYTSVSVSARLKPTSDVEFQVYSATDSADVIGVKYSKNSGLLKTNSGETIGDYTAGPVVIKLVIEDSSQKIFVDDVLAYSTTTGPKTVGGVVVGGSALVDYVRITTSGNKKIAEFVNNLEPLTGDEQLLYSCDSEALAQESNINDRTQYTNLLLYCASTPDGVCDYGELQQVASRYSSCTKEVFNYCVAEAYPLEEGTVNAAGIQGGTTCSALLGTSSLWTGVVKPVVNISWTTITSNALVALVVLLLLVLFIPLMRRR